MIELTQDQKFWLNVLLSIGEDVKHEIVSILKACASSSAMYDAFHTKNAQYVNGVNAIENLVLQPELHETFKMHRPRLPGSVKGVIKRKIGW